ncbi:hypothetical protein [Flammeovirga sp. SJP92]|uniref:MutS-related protein n=1 Tax=Flammeovirga sp. SJP92 TaxID=1775430 RepID=UPI00078954C1|nr:hypothetical protein [Flammeovirga sp. SJP92]KXX68722.1 hypothetical protein AVL50_18795 [Flammeovirga sp. SJP92]
MNTQQLNLKEEIVPLFDDKQNYNVTPFIQNFILNKCSLEELEIRQSIFRCLFSNEKVAFNYKYNKLYFEDALRVTREIKTDQFVEATSYVFFTKSRIKISKIPRLTASLIFFSELKVLIQEVLTIADVPYFNQLLLYLSEDLELLPDYSDFKSHQKELLAYLNILHQIDFDVFWKRLFELECYLSLTKCSIKRGFNLPLIDNEKFEFEKAYFPLINEPVKYDITFDCSLNILNGPNMGGKSTFLKTISLCSYLGNIGFPIPASKATIPFFDTFNINFNTKDNYRNGTSHFMNEILSVKELIVSNQKSEVVYGVFDELFNTTNPEEATRLIEYLFHHLKLKTPSFFIISTHLEIAHLMGNEKIGFFHPSTQLEGDHIQFDYHIVKGISKLKLGEKLFQKSGILELLEEHV